MAELGAAFGYGRNREPDRYDPTPLYDAIDADRAAHAEADRQARREHDERQQAAHLDYLREQAALLREIADAYRDPEGPTA